jgi:hypothetical protein
MIVALSQALPIERSSRRRSATKLSASRRNQHHRTVGAGAGGRHTLASDAPHRDVVAVIKDGFNAGAGHSSPGAPLEVARAHSLR